MLNDNETINNKAATSATIKMQVLQMVSGMDFSDKKYDYHDAALWMYDWMMDDVSKLSDADEKEGSISHLRPVN